jgi:hypothetical protein
MAHSRFEFQQVELRIAEFLAPRTVLLDPLQPQLLLQYLDLQIGQCQCPLQRNQLINFGSLGGGGSDVHGE